MTDPGGIAVVITCHNYGRYLHRCLRSVQAQTLRPSRVVVVDDASDDATEAVAGQFPNVMYERVEYRQANRARNHGFELTDSGMIVFFDADNEMAPTFLESLNDALEQDPGAAFAYCDRINVLEGDRTSVPEPPGHWRSRPFDAELLRRYNYVDMASMIRRSSFPGFDEEMPMYQDWDLWLSVVGQGGRGAHVPRPLFSYRIHGASLGHRTHPEPALWRVHRKHRLGTFGSIPIIRSSLIAFKALRCLRRALGNGNR